MKKALMLGWLLAVFAAGAKAGGGTAFNTGLSPHADGLFFPLRADPRELHFALRTAKPKEGKLAAEVAIGHYYGIYRWALPGDVGYAQVNVGGGIFTRFNFQNDTDLQVIDFHANIPVDIRVKKWSGRCLWHHVSSHLGDDYIRATGQNSKRNSWNSVRSILSYDASASLRLYGGYTNHFLVLPQEHKRHAFQTGIEVFSKLFSGGHSQIYWANDLQCWERTRYKPMFNSQIGIKRGREPKTGRGLSYFLEFTTGPQYHGQFFQREETRVGVGAKFDIG